ncbi:MAG: hypothetical protein GY913_10910 [Proteobacteria bacterium]|nr:hypothetical protein [Pseudomonadota bacterium]MCP4917423.1 hypothetical protein [Pseudomonadota bacterium]
MRHALRPLTLSAFTLSLMACICGGGGPSPEPDDFSGMTGLDMDSDDSAGLGDCGDEYTGPTSIGIDECAPDHVDEAVLIDCDEADWWFDIHVTGPASGGELWIHETGADQPWDEHHDVTVWEEDENSWWTTLYLQLGIVDSFQDVQDGRTTLYQCTTRQRDRLTWHVEVYEMDGSSADCIVTGHDPESLGTGCEVWN